MFGGSKRVSQPANLNRSVQQPVAAPSQSTTSSDEAKAGRFVAIRKLIDTDIRPYVQADGGDIELVEVDGNRVKLRLLGACGKCPSSEMTLRSGVQTRLQAMISADLVVEEVV